MRRSAAYKKKTGKRKDPSHWLRLASTKAVIAYLASIAGNPATGNQAPKLVITKKGLFENGGGTWVHPKLVGRYAAWVDNLVIAWCSGQLNFVDSQQHLEFLEEPEPQHQKRLEPETLGVIDADVELVEEIMMQMRMKEIRLTYLKGEYRQLRINRQIIELEKKMKEKDLHKPLNILNNRN